MESERADYQVFNVGGGKVYTVIEFANIVKDVFQSDINPLMPSEYRYGDTRHIFSDISKLTSIGWKPEKDIYDSVREYKKYLEEQNDIHDILNYAESQMKSLGVVRKAK